MITVLTDILHANIYMHTHKYINTYMYIRAATNDYFDN